MTTKNKVIAGAAVLAIGAWSYARNANFADDWIKHNEPIVGIVLSESYQNTLVPNPKFNGLMSYSNETVKLNSKYTLKVRTDDGKTIGVSIINSGLYGTVTKESLDVLIEEGTIISFPRGNMRAKNFFLGSLHNYDKKETYFQEDTQAGTKRAYRVKVLDKE